jgi:hypothetical protein
MRNKLLVAFKEQYLLNHQTLGSTCKCQMLNSVQNDIQFFFFIILPVLKMCPALSVPQGGWVTCIQNTCIQMCRIFQLLNLIVVNLSIYQ